MGFGDFVDDVLDDINPLNLIDAVNDAIGSSTADILEFLGITDPAVDPDGIREIAKAWKGLADGVGDAAFSAGQAVTGLGLQGKAADAFGTRAQQVRTIAGNVEDSLHKGHDELNKLADQAHDLISQVGVLAAQIAEFEVAGLGLSVLTAGLSDVASTLASGNRAIRIVELFGQVEQIAVRAARMLEDLVADIGGMARILKALKSVTKMAATGMGTTVAWDAMFQPGRLSDPDALTSDLENGAGFGVAFGAAGKAFLKLKDGLGPLGLDFATAGDGGLFGSLADLKNVFGDTVGQRIDQMWMALPDWLKDAWAGGIKFNKDNHARYPANEVAVLADDGKTLLFLDSYDPGKWIVSRKFTQLADVQLDTAKGYISELVAKYSPDTVIRSQKYPGLYGTTLKGQMVLEVPVQSGEVPQELLKYAVLKDVIIKDVDGHVYLPKPEPKVEQ